MNDKIIILIASLAVVSVAVLWNYLSKRRSSCLNRLETLENLLKSVDSEDDEHEWLAMSFYDEIEEANELAFDGFMHRRVGQVVTLWKEKFPSISANWESIYREYYMKNNSYMNEDCKKSIKLLSNGK